MGESKVDQIEGWPHLSVFLKALVSYGLVFGFLSPFVSFSATLEAVRLWIFDNELSLVFAFFGWYAGVMIVEALLRVQKRAIESRRSTPQISDARRKAKAARKARLRNQRS